MLRDFFFGFIKIHILRHAAHAPVYGVALIAELRHHGLAYVQFGTRPAFEWLLYGIKPVIIAIVVQALWGLAKTAVKGPFLAAMGSIVLILNEFIVRLGWRDP
jgi:chromate transport protein ChrA